MLAPAGHAFSFEDLQGRARELAARQFEPDSSKIPNSLLELNYDQYRRIQFNHQRAWWRAEGLPFQIEFFLPGGYHRQIVKINEIVSGHARAIPFEPSLFEIGTNQLPPPSSAGGYAGFRLEYSPANFGEVAAFLDASYFRMIGRGQSYGASARGLAIDTSSGGLEEFPVFKEFWVQRPAKSDTEITVYALLDSPSVSGAYQFVIRPGSITSVAIHATLFPRHEIKQLGIAPLTSMFLYGENDKPPFGDYRPEVHDSDGLLIHNGRGEWIWRPFVAFKFPHGNSFLDENPQGFGLMQRQRSFTAYEDPEARYEDRPSLWVQPHGGWTKGAVELLQLPSTKEITDNLVAFWTPTATPKPNEGLDLAYEILWTTTDPEPEALGHVIATRIGRIGHTSHWHLIVDFAGKLLEAAPGQTNFVPDVSLGAGVQGVATNLFKIEETKAWRLAMEIVEPTHPAELRALLKSGDRPLTETWSFTWHPDEFNDRAQ